MSDTAQSQDYQKLLSDALQKQITILGKQIVLIKARKVNGLQIDDNGHVVAITGEPKEVINQLLQEFQVLSSPLVKKTMQSLLTVVIPPEARQLPSQPVQPPQINPIQQAMHQPEPEHLEGKEGN